MVSVATGSARRLIDTIVTTRKTTRKASLSPDLLLLSNRLFAPWLAITRARPVPRYRSASVVHTRSLDSEGKAMTVGMIWWFFRRKMKIAFFAAITYAALC